MSSLPSIDLTQLETDPATVAARVADACHRFGFFYLTGHGIPPSQFADLEALCERFFAMPLEKKMQISMSRGGLAWRGFFPVGDEFTSGVADLKEGLYFGKELSADDPAVRQGTPLHGANLFPPIQGFREQVLAYIERLTDVGQRLMRAIALSLDLAPDTFSNDFTRDPLVLFRVFHYPARPETAEGWGVGEHTDYGLLTLLHQDSAGGLQVKLPEDGWIDVAPVEGALVCNIGDILDRITRGYYRSVPHRVRRSVNRSRMSFPFFFDPSWNAEIRSLPLKQATRRESRWDGADLLELSGTYGEYLLKKVSRVFPELRDKVLEPPPH